MSTREFRRRDLLPDVGSDVLGDECFTEVFEFWETSDFMFLLSAGQLQLEEEFEVQDYPSSSADQRVHYVWQNISNERPSPPPRHLTILETREEHLESLKHYLHTSNVSTLYVLNGQLEWLCAFLRTQPPESPLQSLILHFDENVGGGALTASRLLDALAAPQCSKVKNLWLSFYNSWPAMKEAHELVALKPSLEHLGRSCRSLWLMMPLEDVETTRAEKEEELETTSAASEKEEELESKKEEKSEKDKEVEQEENIDKGSNGYSYSAAFMNCIVAPVVSQMVHSTSGLKELKAGCIADSQELLTAVCSALQLESCQLTRLDIRGDAEGRHSINWKPEMMAQLLQSVASSACLIQDLGVPLGSPKLSYEDNKRCCSIFAHAFTSGSSLFKIKTLRFDDINTEDRSACVAQVLGSGESSCQVRFLEVCIHSHRQHSEFSFFRMLQDVQARIECVRVKLFTSAPNITNQVLSQLADFVRWENCLLLFIHCAFMVSEQYEPSESDELQLANSLEGNYLLTFLFFHWTSDAAKSRAAAFLDRNRLYKSAGISKEKRVMPKVARLFLCGDGQVGKTTLRKALLELHRHPWISAAYCSKNKMLFSVLQHAEQPTRGLEIHQLAFTQAQKLVIYDLAGQQDYHSFHHFFISNTSNDLFVVVCKVTTLESLDQVPIQLDYWLRFIVSHRNSVRGPNPKVLLIVNFFLPTAAIFHDMQRTAQEITKQLQDKYAEVLDFNSGDNVFGLVASMRKQVKPILQKLKILVSRLLEERPKILELCDDLSSDILPSLMRDAKKKRGISGLFLCTGVAGKEDNQKLIVSFSELLQKYKYLQLQSQTPTTEHRKVVTAALVELHNMGEVVFFPPNNELDSLPSFDQQSAAESSRASSAQMIITDPGWFCNKVVGDLLAPEDENFKGKCQRTKMVVMQIIKEKLDGVCSTQFGDEMFRYMQNLDLCFIIDHDRAEDPNQTQVIFPTIATNNLEQQDHQIQVFFPAVATNKLEWPPVFNKLQVDAAGSSTGDIMQFYGRRLKCKETQIHLIPSGVFSRLQVRLHSFCGVGNTRSYKLGFWWSSFVKDGIAVVVRLGGDVDAGQNQQETGHPEWIDILLCCPPAHNDFKDDERNTSTADTIIAGVKGLIFNICQAISLSIPTVELEDWVLRNKGDAHKDVMPLKDIKDVIAKNGLGGSVSWQSQEITPVVELLLPEELKAHVDGQVRAMRQIQAEFVELDVARTLHSGKEITGVSSTGKSKLEVADAVGQRYQQLSDGQKIMCDLICMRMDERFDRVGVTMEQLLILVKDIRKDVHKLTRELCRMQVNILNNCSSRLLAEVLVKGTLPVYPYLTDDSDGKLKKLKSFLVKKTAKLHFLCEAPVYGPHKVEEQVGKEVVIKADGILVKAAPVLVPALRIMCCAARFAANAYLPGIAPAFFDPLLECLTSLDITSKADLQSEIMTKALNALFDGIDNQNIQHLYHEKETPAVNEGQMRDVVRELLKDYKDLDMHKDFGLNLVDVGSQGAGGYATARTRWVCDAHVHEHTKLHMAGHRNPFL